MKNKKMLSLILSATILLGVNVYYILTTVPPDGRWILQIPITNFFVFIYLALFFVSGNEIVKNPNNTFFSYAIIFNIVVAISFLVFGTKLDIIFRDVMFAHYNFISVSPYIVVFGLGITLYTILNLFLKKRVLTEAN